MEFDMSLLEKVPDDYDIKKIGFVAVYSDSTSTSDSQSADMVIDQELTPPHDDLTAICHICDNVFMNRSNLKRHLNTVHSGKIYKCDICKTTFAKHRLFAYHMRRHNKKKALTCDKCGLIMTSNKALAVHKDIHHAALLDVDIDDIFP